MTTNISTNSKEYTKYYLNKFNIWYRRLFPVDIPFKYIAKSCCKGKILDIGCGPGRYLAFFPDRAIGVDHNMDFIEYTHKRGFTSYHTSELHNIENQKFDTLLFAHILEHMCMYDGETLINTYIKYLNKNGRIIIIVPHGYCYNNDPTHVLYYGPEQVEMLSNRIGFHIRKSFYHPFPDFLSKYFITDGIYILEPNK